ncbi:MAG TPA: alanine racemase [Candidatus Ozemobacteraceae bacterium]|nr:alanine racemase [Candidatus Ozemobacteraceae bacterium]
MLYQTHARIHLQNIRYNLDGIRRAVGPDRKIMIAVKANAYGHGAVEVSKMAEKIGIDWLAVATVPEGIQLRRAGIRLPILKLSPCFPEEMDAAIESGIAMTVCERSNLKALNEAAGRLRKRVNVHLKVDTGMGRIGCQPDEAPDMAGLIVNELTNLVLEGVFTHLPVSDDATTSFTERQIACFKKVVDSVEKRIHGRVPLVHCSNSAAVLGHQDGWFNLVRPGIMVYGFYPSKDTPQTIPLRPGMSVLTRVSFLKKVTAGTSVGYGRTWIAPEDTWVATFPAGYADGMNRLWSNQGRVLIGGKSYPVIGRVCMDQSMANLGPRTHVQVGDQVVLIGAQGDEEITAQEWADKLGTITYEVTCRIDSRVERVFDPYE